MKIQIYGDVQGNLRIHTYLNDKEIQTKITKKDNEIQWGGPTKGTIVENVETVFQVETPVIPEDRTINIDTIREHFNQHVDSINLALMHLNIGEDQYVIYEDFTIMALYQTLSALPQIIKDERNKPRRLGTDSIFHHVR